jgi:predicted DNA-binding transcriptional regulator YafY
MTSAMPTPSRPATYHTATRLARIVYGLIGRPYGWSLTAIQAELAISERTLLRYLAACRKELVDRHGRPLLVVERRGDHRVLRLTDATQTPESSSYQALSFYFARSVFDFLDGTVLKDGVQDLWERFYRTLPVAQRTRLAQFDKKFFSIPYAPKDYRGSDDVIDTLLQCLVHQHTMRVAYDSPWRGTTPLQPHDVDPYTLAMYRGGLYVIGRSHKHRKILYLAVERIRTASKLPERFDYPVRYSPAAHTEGAFGIIDGPETDVQIRIVNAEGMALLSARRLHPTQRFTPQPDGSTLLALRVRGTAELENWILSLGPHVEVLQPPELRARVAASIQAMAQRYKPSRGAPAVRAG